MNMSDEMIHLFPYSSISFLLTSHCSLTTFRLCISLSFSLHLSSLCYYHYPAVVHLRDPSFSLSFSHTPCFFHCHPITVLSRHLSFSLTIFSLSFSLSPNSVSLSLYPSLTHSLIFRFRFLILTHFLFLSQPNHPIQL